MRTHGKPKNKAPPLSPKQLFIIAQYLEKNGTLQALRDSAVLQVGFFGAFRRSELVSIKTEHLQWHEKGVEILIPSSKTDQSREGQYCVLPLGNEMLCPIRAIKKWLKV